MLLPLAAILAHPVAAPCRAEETFPIRLARPVKIGDLTYVTQQDTFEATYTIQREDKILQSNKRKTVLEFAGLVEALAVDSKGAETRLRIKVDKFTAATDDKPPAEVLKPGHVVIAESTDNKTTFHMLQEKEWLSKEAEQYLGRLFATATGLPEDDEIFSPAEPQPVGATWPANKDLLLARLRDFDPRMEADRVSGSGELLAAPLVDGQRWTEVKFQLQADSTWPPNPPPETVPYRGTLKVTATARLPVDPTPKSTVVRTLEMRMNMAFNGKPDGRYRGLTLHYDSLERRESKAEDRTAASP